MNMGIMRILGGPFGIVMWGIYEVLQNYLLALFVFTILTRLVIAPIMFRTHKGSTKMAVMQPQMQELQKKYANNKQKLNEEMNALYKREGHNPMAGCLPMLFQMVILFGVIDVIFRPLTHILRISAETVDLANEITVRRLYGTNVGGAVELTTLGQVYADSAYYLASGIPAEAVDRMLAFVPQMHVLGLDLMATPGINMILQFNPIVLIPILSGLTSAWLSFSMRHNPTQQMSGGANAKIMMLMMPLMSFGFAFNFPAGVGIYWIFSNIATVVQNGIMNKLYNPREEAEKARQEAEERRERERTERIEAKKKAKESGLEDIESLPKKEQNRRRLAEARRRDAEKYGEEYIDSDDD